jgi:YVTN family beta-propeller protein
MSLRNQHVWAGCLALAAIVGIAGAASAGETYHVGLQPDGSFVLPTDQIIRPAGRAITFDGRPTALAIRPDGRTAALLRTSGGWFPYGGPILVVDLVTGRIKQEFVPYESADGSFTGIAYSANGSKLYASDPGGAVMVANVAADGTLSKAEKILLPVTDPSRGVSLLHSEGSNSANPGGLALSADGRRLYVALNMNNSLAIIDLTTNSVISEIPVGNAPHAVVVEGSLAYVTNQGGRVATGSDYTNASAGTPIVADPATGRPTTGTVSVVDLNACRTVASIDVGLQPTAMLLHQGRLFVANSNSDTVSVIDTRNRAVVKTISIQPFSHAPFGSSPNALAMLPDDRLVVSLGSNNALAIYGWKGPSAPVTLQGLIPTAWYPSDLAVDRTSKRLIVPSLKGTGSPETKLGLDFKPSKTGTGNSVLQFVGLASVIRVPTTRQLAQQTRQVIANNRWGNQSVALDARPTAMPKAIPERIGEPSLIKHVFYIIKENLTYDQVLGDDARGNGDPANLQFGVAVTPNHHALVSRFPLLDNYYASTTVSIDGHQWANSAFVVDYIERGFGGQFKRSYPFNGGDSLAYAPTGFIWENALRHGKSVRVFGEYAARFDGPKARYGRWADWFRDSQIMEGKLSGSLHVGLGEFQAKSDEPSVDAHLNRNFPGFYLEVPDQYRADIFLAEFDRHLANHDLPDLTIMTLPCDHTEGLMPDYPTPRAETADNDLALGRIVETISQSPYWRDSAIFVIEDDAANGVDHVNAHRSPAFVISPYARRGFVDHSYYTQIDVVRTIEQILGLPPMNQNDLVATPMRTAFSETADIAPYEAVPNKIRLDEMNESHASNALHRAWEQESVKMFSPWPPHPDTADENLMRRVIWYANFDFKRPFPGDDRVLLPIEVRRSTKKKDD